MKFTKLIAVLLALLLIAGLFAACGGEENEETRPTATLPAPEVPGGNQSTDSDLSGQESGLSNSDGGKTETKPAEPGEQTPAETESDPAGSEPAATQPASTQPADSQPAATQPASTEPAPGESGTPASYDSNEDLPVGTTEHTDDSSEDLH